MSEEDQSAEKSFDPTPKKLLDARKRGEFARSNDISAAAALYGLFFSVVLGSMTIVPLTFGNLRRFVKDPEGILSGSGELVLTNVVDSVLFGILLPTSMFFLISALFVLLSLTLQRSFVFAPSKISPKFSKISPLTGLKNKLGRNGIFEFLKSSAKLIVTVLLTAYYLRDQFSGIILLSYLSPAQVTYTLNDSILEFLFLAALITLIIGGLDYIWQFFENIRKNRMSRRDIEDENKSSEGDPQNKQNRRQKGYEIMASSTLSDVQNADVIIVNPTHYAVAIKWNEKSKLPPICIAKGIDLVAAKIREIALESKIPIHSDPPTARSLYARIEVGEIILPEDYRAVAAAIRFAQHVAKQRTAS